MPTSYWKIFLTFLGGGILSLGIYLICRACLTVHKAIRVLKMGPVERMSVPYSINLRDESNLVVIVEEEVVQMGVEPKEANIITEEDVLQVLSKNARVKIFNYRIPTELIIIYGVGVLLKYMHHLLYFLN